MPPESKKIDFINSSYRFPPPKPNSYLYFQQLIRKQLQPIKLNKERLVFFFRKKFQNINTFFREARIYCNQPNCNWSWDILAKNHTNTGNAHEHFKKKHNNIARSEDDIERAENICTFIFYPEKNSQL
jgi:hypothetical protein